jgi:hypothetical protein
MKSNEIKNHVLLILLFMILPVLLQAQENKTGFEVLLQQLNEEQLQEQISNVNHEIFSSSVISAGGLSLAAFGGLAAYLGVELLLAEPIIDFNPDNELMMMMWPLVLTVYVIQYGGGLALIGGGGNVCVTGLGISVTATGNIFYQLDKKRQIRLELKNFQPTSYKDRPGFGVGISIPLN